VGDGPDAEERYRALVDEMRAEFPRLALIDKRSSLLQRAIGRALQVVTLGGQSAYGTRYVTTIGQRIYLPSEWSERDADDRYVTMRHERVHLRQFRRFTLPLMALAYLFLPLPLGLAWCRYRLEREAYEETIVAAAERWGIEVVRAAAFRERLIGQFTSGAYGWMWPFSRALGRWYDRVLASLGG
jgi:hypothetical protein